MRTSTALVVALLIVSAVATAFPAGGVGAAAAVSSAQGEGTSFLKGVAVFYSGRDAEEPLITALLLDLRRLNVDAIELTFPIYLDGWDGSCVESVVEDRPETAAFEDTPSVEELVLFSQVARAQGFSVVLKPLIDERSIVDSGPPGSWRGTIQPANPAEFFVCYGALLQGYAQLAMDEEIAWLVAASELNSLESDDYEHLWEEVFAELQATIGDEPVGVTYAQNWDMLRNSRVPSWFAALDALALDAYMPLEGLGPEPSVDEVAAELAGWQDRLEEFRAAAPDKPFFISEIGVASQRSTPSVLEVPWSWPNPSLPTDLQVQATFVAAACRVFSGIADGMFWWHTSVVHAADPLKDNSFDFIGKPAADQIGRCYRANAGQPLSI